MINGIDDGCDGNLLEFWKYFDQNSGEILPEYDRNPSIIIVKFFIDFDQNSVRQPYYYPAIQMNIEFFKNEMTTELLWNLGTHEL